ncbi:MAG: menaquinol-cytochrome c reductase cytochrome b subunit [Acidimicrobiia bacterium]|nr:menaquinol-cytochrome c reductase cytochrome b subunit [Acidimicrobiia bacterium]
MADIPEHILRRSAEARAKKEGRPVEEILAEMKGGTEEAPSSQLPAAGPKAEPPIAEPPSSSSPSGGGVAAGDGGGQALTGAALPTPARVPTPDSTQVAATAATATIDSGTPHSDAKSDRLLTVIRAGEVQRIRSEPTDRVNVWPHLLAIEFVALLVVLTLLITLAVFLDAPLLEFANFNEQPNPSKAPWYFLGLQELLAYFDPQVAGIIIPGFGLASLALIPYIDKNPSVRPSHRKLAIMIFTFFIMAAAVLTIFGSFFRGPGFNFTFPWHDGIFFDDLKSLLG